jgi:hypothetical protein
MPLTQNYDKFLILGRLTDRRIAKYQKLGFYGVDAMRALQARDAKRNRASEERKKQADKPSKKELLRVY